MKRRFEWRLERVLAIRAIETEVARGTWAAAEARAHAADERVEKALAALLEGRAEVARWQTSPRLDARRILATQSVLASLAAALHAARAAAIAARAEADLRRHEWVAADRAREALARGRERALEEHRAELARSDASAMDEAASARRQRDG